MNSKEYWAKREAEQLKHNITEEKEYDKQIKRIYSDMLDSCQKEINAFYGRYAAKEDITLAEAKKRVAQLDIKEYERKAKRYVRDKDFSEKANEEMRLYNATMKINRLEMLKANIGLELISGHNELEKFMSGILQGRTEDELTRQAGILGKTIKNNAATAHAIVNGSFHNGTFSDRIWLYQDLLRADIGKLLQSGLIAGKNPRLLAKELKQTFKVSTYNAERLMRTELARVQTEAQKQSFERNGFEEYEFICNSNGNTCEICQGLHGKHFRVDKMLVGTNAPPMHPHCRCSTAAYSDRSEYDKWLDWIAKGGTTVDYDTYIAKEKEKIPLDRPIKDPNIDKLTENGIIKETLTFEDGKEVNDFFYYDGEERGLKARGESLYGKWKKSLTTDEQNALYSYTGDAYYDINNFFRKVGDWKHINPNMVKNLSESIDSSISRFTLKQNITVQRGVMNDFIDMLVEQNNVQESLAELVGKKYVEAGYSSTTALKGNPVATSKPTILEIEVPAGVGRGAYINQYGAQFEDTEYEFLIKRNASFTIKEVKEEVFMGENRYYIKLVMDE